MNRSRRGILGLMDAELREALEAIRLEILSMRGELGFVRMEALGTRGAADETRRHMDVVAEDLRGEIRQVAEGVMMANERIDRLDAKVELYHAENKEDFDAIRRACRRTLSDRTE